MTLHDVVADVGAAARPAARSPDAKAAIAYLISSAATTIQIIENENGCTFRIGTKLDARAASVHWLREAEARAVMVAARRIAGKGPDIATATSALHQAACDQRVTMTEHRTAMDRAGEAANRLDRSMDSLRGTGVLVEFNRAFKRRRMEAALNGRGVMSFGSAMLRFKRALVPLLVNGGQPAVGASLFARVLDGK
jgi:hypothetical protein